MCTVLILGVDCVGRKTILPQVDRILEEKGCNSAIVHFSEKMLEALKTIDPKNRHKKEDLATISMALRRKAQLLTAADLITVNGTGIFRIISGQTVIEDHESFISGILDPEYMIDLLGISAVLMLRDNEGEISKRREKSGLQKRMGGKWLSLPWIRQAQELELSVSSGLAIKTGRSFSCIDRSPENGENDHDGAIDRTAAEIVRTFERLKLPGIQNVQK